MALSGVPDLSIITDRLVGIIRTAINAAGLAFTVEASGSTPESVSLQPNCQLTMYLYHIAADSTSRNTPITGQQTPRQRPFGLNLYYLLSAFSKNEYVQEQHAMTIAMRALHDTPFIRISGVEEELSATMENESIDKLGVLWQAVSTPFRLSASYRVAIAFITPPDDAPASAPIPTSIGLTVDPAALPFSDAGHLSGAFTRFQFVNASGADSDLVSNNLAVPGRDLTVLGAGLNRPGATDHVFLSDAAGSNEQDITSWRNPAPEHNSESRMTLIVPPTAPSPGLYQLLSGGTGSRTNSIPLALAASVTNVENPPLFDAAAGPHTIEGTGFIAGQTQLSTGSATLIETSAAPNNGEFQVQSGTSILFRASSNLAAGVHAIRLRVNGIESPPSWWVSV